MKSLVDRCLSPPTLTPSEGLIVFSLSLRILKRSVDVYKHLVQNFDIENPFSFKQLETICMFRL